MKKPLIVVVVIGVVVAIVIAVLSRRESANVASGSRPADAPMVTRPETPAGSAARPEPAKGVRRLAASERQALAAQIAAARSRARERAAADAAGGATAPSLDDTITLEQVSKTVQDALREAIPILAECYQQPERGDAARERTAAVQMTMTSDPEVGTVIDTDAMHDRAGKPLDPAIDDCLRTTIESLGLPPLEVGGKLKLEYSFVFD